MYGNVEGMGGGSRRPQPMIKSFDSLIRSSSQGAYTGGDVVEGLAKALATGAISGYGDATPLRLENLDSTMTEVLVTSAHLKLFRAIPRVPSIQEYFQWMRQTSYGSHRGSPGFVQGGAPAGGNSAWARGNATVRWMGVKRGYTHQLQVTGQMGGTFIDPIAAENSGGTRQLLEMIERWLIWGQANILDKNGNTVNYDGIYQQLKARPKSIIDKKGEPLDFGDLEMIGFKMNTDGKLLDFSNLMTVWHPKVLSDLGALKLEAERVSLGSAAPPAGYRPGVRLNGYATQFGDIPLDSSIVLDQVENNEPLATAQSGAASRPASVSGAASADAASKMAAGTYYYFVASTNDSGESDTRASAGVVIASGEKAVLTIDRVTEATGYRVYRGTVNDATKAGWIGWIPQPGSGNATFNDLNEIRPKTWMGLILNLSSEDIALAQMAPLVKYPLAQIDTTIPFLLMLYHALAVKALERAIMVINIGDRIPRDIWMGE